MRTIIIAAAALAVGTTGLAAVQGPAAAGVPWQVTVKAGSTVLATYSNLNKASGYTLRSLSLGTAHAGHTVTVKFLGVEDSSLQTSFVIDDTALNVS